ncbi:unnamed protein product [Clonostachys byssicola]|uniref:Bifunctional cytochrome P450/NADPH--P450 reductase n=1 Tax=Clonostachys byssicola TaxID=160290 RepID=A0A9N9XVE5_9HYPO|nr:unnamed protein product [Clonostachys byssicola]
MVWGRLSKLAKKMWSPMIAEQVLIRIATNLGPIFGLTFGGKREVYITNQKLLAELCDEKRFCKLVSGGLEKLRPAIGDGLFTAHDGNHDWGLAHRVLMPVFGTLKIREMFDDMVDISQQLCLKWADNFDRARLGPSVPLDVSKDFTRLTVDTIALCAMDYRINSFYLNDKLHRFVETMFEVLAEADIQGVLPSVANKLRVTSSARFKKNIQTMADICHEIIEQRRKNPVDSHDLLNTMLQGRDPQTGEALSERIIIHNMITFLMAGHETTSGLLSFTFYYLLENKTALEKAREEVDSVVGQDALSIEHLGRLPYIDAVLKESLRLMPTAPGFFLKSRKDEIIGGAYEIKPEDPIFVLLHLIHRDPAVWGDDSEEFRPERMLKENLDKIPQHSWKPFGNGTRACIGRAFAMQEAQLVCAMLIQNFDLEKVDPNYKLQYKQTLTIKPVGFEMRVRLRDGRRALQNMRSAKPQAPSLLEPSLKQTSLAAPLIRIYYGSNSGTCEALAHRIAFEAAKRGFRPDNVSAINAIKDGVPRDSPIVFVAASYDGEPSENAAEFVSWLQGVDDGGLAGVKYAIFGCGHRDWQATLHKVPKTIDHEMQRTGAERLVPLGTVDTGSEDIYSALEGWLSEGLWQELEARYQPQQDGKSTGLEVTVSVDQPPRLAMLPGFIQATVTEISALSRSGVPRKRHLEIRFPPGATYEAGDHLQVLPTNSLTDVRRVLSRFALGRDTMLTIESTRPLGLPINVPVTAFDLFSGYVELFSTATPKAVQMLMDAADDESTKAELELLARASYKSEVRDKRLSVLDLLERFPAIDLTISTFLPMLPQMRPRTYSLSSSAQWRPGHGTLTYSVVESTGAREKGTPNIPPGVASTYLASLGPGDTICVALQPSKRGFSLPLDPTLPIIMICAGSGLAPFRGLVQDRVCSLQASAQPHAPALLFYGCRGRILDDMYRSEMEEYEAAGAVRVFRAYSREPGAKHRYVQDLVSGYRKEICQLWRRGGVIRVCGGKKISDAVFEALGPILFSADKTAGNTVASDVTEWKSEIGMGRYVTEVFN